MMNELTEYLTDAIDRIVRQALRACFKNPVQSTFIMKYLLWQKAAAKRRRKNEIDGRHIPPFLIASIASQCNLHCKGCYARENHACHDTPQSAELSAQEWTRIFKEAGQLGVAFILLAGGEPMLRTDVLAAASRFQNIVFPVFTNGTMLDAKMTTFFHKNRNLVPVLSLEGDGKATDDRRGAGVETAVRAAMARLDDASVFYGVSVTVTTENVDAVTDADFISGLRKRGCKLALFVEYVPFDAATTHLAPTQETRVRLSERQQALRDANAQMIFISFPGDEGEMGGCLAAGRGFFHINPSGGAEPCPFSPYSDISLKDRTLLEVMQSPFFKRLADLQHLQGEHAGGCVLFDHRAQVEDLLKAD